MENFIFFAVGGCLRVLYEIPNFVYSQSGCKVEASLRPSQTSNK